MQLTEKLIAELVRQRLGLKDSGGNVRFMFLIPEALKRTARKIAVDPSLRDLLLSDRETAVLPITGNKCLLNDGYTNHRFLSEYISDGKIYHESSPINLQSITPTQAGLIEIIGWSESYIPYYREKDALVLPNGETGELSFSVSTYPANLAQLPVSEEVQTLFIDKLVEMLPEMNRDSAEDGPK